jgi:hypothetical protein
MNAYQQPAEPDPQAARDALRAAQRSRAASGTPQPLPGWYGPVIGALMAGYVASSDLVRVWHAPWVFAVTGLVYAFCIGLAVGVARLRHGVVTRLARAYLLPSMLACAACLLIGGAGYAAAWAVGWWARGTIGGLAAGLAFWAAAILLNRRIRRDVATGRARSAHA